MADTRTVVNSAILNGKNAALNAYEDGTGALIDKLQTLMPDNMYSNRQHKIAGDYIGYILYNPENDQSKWDAILLYSNDQDMVDEHSASFSQVDFMGRNEPVQIYQKGGARKFSVELSLVARKQKTSTGFIHTGDVDKLTRYLHRDDLTTADVDYLARVMLAWTYSSYKKQFNAPKRVWLSYGNFITRLPCIVESVSRTIPKNSPWEKVSARPHDYMPFIQNVRISLVVCPESLYVIPDSTNIATRVYKEGGSANNKYGTPGNYPVYDILAQFSTEFELNRGNLSLKSSFMDNAIDKVLSAVEQSNGDINSLAGNLAGEVLDQVAGLAGYGVGSIAKATNSIFDSNIISPNVASMVAQNLVSGVGNDAINTAVENAIPSGSLISIPR